MEGIIVGAIISVVGVIIGLIWNEFSRWLADRRLKRQTVNKTISLLLELYFQIKRISITVQQSQSSIEELFVAIKGKELTEDEKQVVRTILSTALYPLVKETVSNDINKITSDYDSILKELSCYYPVDAYRLRGRTDIKNTLSIIDTYYRKINESFPINYVEYNEIVANIKPLIQSQAIQDQLLVINEEIETLSKYLDCRQCKDIKKTLNDIIDDDNEGVKKRIEDLKPFILEQIKTMIPNSAI